MHLSLNHWCWLDGILIPHLSEKVIMIDTPKTIRPLTQTVSDQIRLESLVCAMDGWMDKYMC